MKWAKRILKKIFFFFYKLYKILLDCLQCFLYTAFHLLLPRTLLDEVQKYVIMFTVLGNNGAKKVVCLILSSSKWQATPKIEF